MKNLRKVRKALIPLVVAGVLSALAVFGITEDMTVAEAVEYIAVSALVWLVPNDMA